MDDGVAVPIGRVAWRPTSLDIGHGVVRVPRPMDDDVALIVGCVAQRPASLEIDHRVVRVPVPWTAVSPLLPAASPEESGRTPLKPPPSTKELGTNSSSPSSETTSRSPLSTSE
uniref:Uncharacterized protein n=1 Tax=Arundo donax TaxID=35708 RepID=A0A0A8Z587_ARUDO